MQTFDQALLKLIEEDRVAYEEALQIASRPQGFRLMSNPWGWARPGDTRPCVTLIQSQR